MLIEIDTDVVIPCDVPRVIKRTPRIAKIPASLKSVVRAYQEAYKLVYGVTPEVKFTDGYIRIKGQDAGVTRVRLREMTTQLKWRAG